MGKSTGLAKAQQRALRRLTTLPALRRFYLAGGTAVAWHLQSYPEGMTPRSWSAIKRFFVVRVAPAMRALIDRD